MAVSTSPSTLAFSASHFPRNFGGEGALHANQKKYARDFPNGQSCNARHLRGRWLRVWTSSVTALRMRRSRGIPGERGPVGEGGRASLDSSRGRTSSAIAASEVALSFSRPGLGIIFQQRQFRYTFLSFALSWGARKTLQEILIGLGSAGIIGELIALELRADQHGV